MHPKKHDHMQYCEQHLGLGIVQKWGTNNQFQAGIKDFSKSKLQQSRNNSMNRPFVMPLVSYLFQQMCHIYLQGLKTQYQFGI